jgi:hypothetical protein
MVRTLAISAAVLTVSVCVGANALAKKQAAEKAPATVSVQVKNTCATEAKIRIGTFELALAPGAESESQTLEGTENWSYPLFLAGATDLGLLSLEPGGQYLLELNECGAAGANVNTRNLAERPAAASPNAAAEVRFRARQNVHLEYKAGNNGRFKPLSVAMTKYAESPAGEYEFTFRLRAAKGGPVMKMVTRKVTLEAGHRYLVEANVAGTEVFFKKEDEGFPKKG